MKKKYFILLIMSVFFCFAQAQTTHFINWEMSVGANATITIDVGDEIVWTNVDGASHNVISNDPDAPAGFGSGIMGLGDTYSFTFNTPVVFDYMCGFHPSMNGTITVLAAATCDPPTNLMLGVVTDTSAGISWTASPDETGGYNWAVMADGDHPTTDTPVQSGSTLTGVTNALATGLTANTDYDFFVQTDCGATTTSTWAGPLNFITDVSPTTFPAPYCGPITFEFGIEPITNVVVAGIANTSSAAIGGTAHEDYTGITGTMEQGGNYSIALEGNTDGNWQNFFTVFIDWNQNDVLDDAGEMYQIGSITNSTGIDGQQATGVISVPVGATLGQTRMRVFKVYEVPNGFVTDPCSMTQNFGQVEDYTILVVPEVITVCDEPTGLALNNVTETTADFSWTPSPDETGGYEWVVMLMGDNPITDPPADQGSVATGTTGATSTGLSPDTMYQAYVKTICDMGAESDYAGPLNFTTDEVMSIHDNERIKLSYFPNPTSGILTIDARTVIESVEVFTLRGQKVLESQANQQSVQLDLSNLAKGVYMLKTSFEDGAVKAFRIIRE